MASKLVLLKLQTLNLTSIKLVLPQLEALTIELCWPVSHELVTHSKSRGLRATGVVQYNKA